MRTLKEYMKDKIGDFEGEVNVVQNVLSEDNSDKPAQLCIHEVLAELDKMSLIKRHCLDFNKVE